MLGHVLFNTGRGNILLEEGEREDRFEFIFWASCSPDICHAHVSLWSFGMNNVLNVKCIQFIKLCVLMLSRK